MNQHSFQLIFEPIHLLLLLHLTNILTITEPPHVQVQRVLAIIIDLRFLHLLQIELEPLLHNEHVLRQLFNHYFLMSFYFLAAFFTRIWISSFQDLFFEIFMQSFFNIAFIFYLDTDTQTRLINSTGMVKLLTTDLMTQSDLKNVIDNIFPIIQFQF